MAKAYDRNVEAMVDVVLLEQLGLEAGRKETVSVALTAFNLLQAFSSQESIPLQKITKEVLISRIAGKKVAAEDVARARRHIQALLKSADPPKRRAARRA